MISEKDFEILYHDYKNLVYNLSLHYVLNTEDAQDITQEVFVKVYRRYEQFNPAASSLKTWICRIAINQSLDFLKAKKTNKRFGFITSLLHPESNEPLLTPPEFNHPGVAAEDKEAVGTLLQIIHSLPGSQKTAIILTKIEGRPQKEVAEIMKTSTKAVESLLQRAKRTIAEKLKKAEGF